MKSLAACRPGILLVCLAILDNAALADDNLEFHGYLRSGMGASGTYDQQCFANTGFKFRLGNECETYLETTFVKKFQGEPGGEKPWSKGTITFAWSVPGHGDWEGHENSIQQDENGEPILQTGGLANALREAWVGIGGLTPGKSELWAGKRFYRRKNVDMIDYYYLANTGPGVGISNLPAPTGHLHAAWFRRISGSGQVRQNLDLRWTDLPCGGGQCSAALIWSTSGSRAADGTRPFAPLQGRHLSLTHESGGNRLVLQLGDGLFGPGPGDRGPAHHLSDFGPPGVTRSSTAADDRKKARAIRLIETWHHHGPNLSAGLLLMIDRLHFGGARDNQDRRIPDVHRTTLGARPVWHFSRGFNLALEAGMVHVEKKYGLVTDADKARDSTLTKLTLAPTWAVDTGYWGRPQIRLFATAAQWSDADKEAGIGNAAFTGRQGYAVGSQVEVWF